MEKTLQVTKEISISLDPGDGAVLKTFQIKPAAGFAGTGQGWIAEYVLEAAAVEDERLPQPAIDINFPMAGVSSIRLSTDFQANSRIGMHYMNRLETRAMGFEPYVLFADCSGENLCFAGADRPEVPCTVQADCYGQSPEGTTAESGAHIRMTRQGRWEETGQDGKIFRDSLYLDTSGEEAHEVIGRYFQWLGRRCTESQLIPAWGDGVQWHSWYAFGQQISQAVIERQSDLADKLGITRIHIDLGWDIDEHQPDVSGHNRPNPVRFPDFRGLIDRMHQRGQKVSLRWTPFMLHPDTHAGQALYPDRIRPEPVNPYGHYFYPCPRCAKTGDVLVQEAVRLVRDYDIDELWFDMMDDFAELYGHCDGDHPHLPGLPGEHVVRIIGEIVRAVKAEKPDFGISFRRQEITPLFRPFVTHAWPHDRYHDYLGNLRECLLVRKLVDRELVHNVCMCWNKTERPEIVANHLMTMIFGGIPAVSVDLSAQSAANRSILERYIRLYQAHKEWLNPAKRVILCPEDAIRAIRIDGENESWILCTGTPPGRIELPQTAKRICVFVTAATSFDALLPVQGTWTGAVFNCFLEKTSVPRIEKLHEGIHVSAKGTPLFGIDLVNWQQQQTLGSDQAEQCKSGGVGRI